MIQHSEEPWFSPVLHEGHEIVGTVVGHGFIHFAEGVGRARYYRVKCESPCIGHTYSDVVAVDAGEIIRIPYPPGDHTTLDVGARVKVSVQKKVRNRPLMGRSAMYYVANFAVTGNA
jgi:hypothetical protein